MAMLMPSEKARLVLGYMKEEGFSKSYKVFLSDCHHLHEYSEMLKRGREYPTSVGGISLNQILDDYMNMKYEEMTCKDMPMTSMWLKFDNVVHEIKSRQARFSSGDINTKSQGVRTKMLSKMTKILVHADNVQPRRRSKAPVCREPPPVCLDDDSDGGDDHDFIDHSISRDEDVTNNIRDNNFAQNTSTSTTVSNMSNLSQNHNSTNTVDNTTVSQTTQGIELDVVRNRTRKTMSRSLGQAIRTDTDGSVAISQDFLQPVRSSVNGIPRKVKLINHRQVNRPLSSKTTPRHTVVPPGGPEIMTSRRKSARIAPHIEQSQQTNAVADVSVHRDDIHTEESIEKSNQVQDDFLHTASTEASVQKPTSSSTGTPTRNQGAGRRKGAGKASVRHTPRKSPRIKKGPNLLETSCLDDQSDISIALDDLVTKTNIPEKLAQTINNRLQSKISQDSFVRSTEDNHRLEDILDIQGTNLDEETVRGVIDMTCNDPVFDALFDLFGADKHAFIEKEYGVSTTTIEPSTSSNMEASNMEQCSSTSNIEPYSLPSNIEPCTPPSAMPSSMEPPSNIEPSAPSVISPVVSTTLSTCTSSSTVSVTPSTAISMTSSASSTSMISSSISLMMPSTSSATPQVVPSALSTTTSAALPTTPLTSTMASPMPAQSFLPALTDTSPGLSETLSNMHKPDSIPDTREQVSVSYKISHESSAQSDVYSAPTTPQSIESHLVINLTPEKESINNTCDATDVVSNGQGKTNFSKEVTCTELIAKKRNPRQKRTKNDKSTKGGKKSSTKTSGKKNLHVTPVKSVQSYAGGIMSPVFKTPTRDMPSYSCVMVSPGTVLTYAVSPSAVAVKTPTRTAMKSYAGATISPGMKALIRIASPRKGPLNNSIEVISSEDQASQLLTISDVLQPTMGFTEQLNMIPLNHKLQNPVITHNKDSSVTNTLTNSTNNAISETELQPNSAIKAKHVPNILFKSPDSSNENKNQNVDRILNNQRRILPMPSIQQGHIRVLDFSGTTESSLDNIEIQKDRKRKRKQKLTTKKDSRQTNKTSRSHSDENKIDALKTDVHISISESPKADRLFHNLNQDSFHNSTEDQVIQFSTNYISSPSGKVDDVVIVTIEEEELHPSTDDSCIADFQFAIASLNADTGNTISTLDETAWKDLVHPMPTQKIVAPKKVGGTSSSQAKRSTGMPEEKIKDPSKTSRKMKNCTARKTNDSRKKATKDSSSIVSQHLDDVIDAVSNSGDKGSPQNPVNVSKTKNTAAAINKLKVLSNVTNDDDNNHHIEKAVDVTSHPMPDILSNIGDDNTTTHLNSVAVTDIGNENMIEHHKPVTDEEAAETLVSLAQNCDNGLMNNTEVQNPSCENADMVISKQNNVSLSEKGACETRSQTAGIKSSLAVPKADEPTNNNESISEEVKTPRKRKIKETKESKKKSNSKKSKKDKLSTLDIDKFLDKVHNA